VKGPARGNEPLESSESCHFLGLQFSADEIEDSAVHLVETFNKVAFIDNA
jgi:hypothetical protein